MEILTGASAIFHSCGFLWIPVESPDSAGMMWGMIKTSQNCSRLSFTQVNHSLRKIKAMTCTLNCNDAANHCVFELYHILESVCAKMTTGAILTAIVARFMYHVWLVSRWSWCIQTAYGLVANWQWLYKPSRDEWGLFWQWLELKIEQHVIFCSSIFTCWNLETWPQNKNNNK